MSIRDPRRNKKRKFQQNNPRARKKTKEKSIKLDIDGWNTTDADEIERRQLRGQVEKFQIKNIDVH